MIKFTFGCHDSKNKASSVLSGWTVVPEEEELNCSLKILTEGTVDELTSILVSLKENQVEVERFEQLMPTLEDAFFEIIGYEK
jgi:ABC-type uncharacterized transport system ATPase subunit